MAMPIGSIIAKFKGELEAHMEGTRLRATHTTVSA